MRNTLLNRVFYSIKRYLARWIDFKSERVLGKRVEFSTYEDFYQMYQAIFVRKIYYFKANSESPIIIDAGANIGLATIYFKNLYPKALILAFEPSPTVFNLLVKNTKHLVGVTCKHAALSNKDGELEYFLYQHRPSDVAGTIMSNIAKTKHALFNQKSKAVMVPTIRLSENFTRADFLKIDVEGAEILILRDLAESGKLKDVSELVMEYEHHRIASAPNLPEILELLQDFETVVWQDGDAKLPIRSTYERKKIWFNIISAWQHTQSPNKHTI